MLRPALTLAELYPAGSVLSGRPSPGSARWLRGSSALRDFLAGETLSVVGAMPLVLSLGSTTPAGLELLAEAGLEVPARVHTFTGAESYLVLLAGLAAGGARLALSHAHLPGELPESSYVVPRPLLCELNNKRNLDALVAARHRPAARVVDRPQLSADHEALSRLPVVVKGAVDDPTGGGTAVRICRTASEVAAALVELASCQGLLVEELVAHASSFNVQVGIPPSGEPCYLGTSEQVVTSLGRYRGNLLEAGLVPPEGAVELALVIARDAARRGYCGVLGIDLAVSEGGSLVVFDLNFRLNGSTPALLLAAAVSATTGATTLRYRTFEGRDGFVAALAVARRALRGGWFVPLNTFDSASSRDPEAKAWLSGVVLGCDRGEVARREEELGAAGLV